MKKQVLQLIGHEPITLDEAKEYCRVYHNADDAFILGTLIPSVREFFEERLDISLCEKRIRVVVENAEPRFKLPEWPIDSIEMIEPADLTEQDGRLNNKGGENIGVTYLTDAYVKAQVRGAMLNLIAHWYVNRDMSTVPEGVDRVIKTNTRVLWFV